MEIPEYCPICDYDNVPSYGIDYEGTTYWMCRNCMGAVIIYQRMHDLRWSLQRFGLLEKDV